MNSAANRFPNRPGWVRNLTRTPWLIAVLMPVSAGDAQPGLPPAIPEVVNRRVALSTSLAFGGTNAALVITAGDGQ